MYRTPVIMAKSDLSSKYVKLVCASWDLQMLKLICSFKAEKYRLMGKVNFSL